MDAKSVKKDGCGAPKDGDVNWTKMIQLIACHSTMETYVIVE